MMDILSTQSVKEEISLTKSMKRINPIKISVIHLSEKNLYFHRMKGHRGKTWGWRPIEYGADKKGLKGAVVNLRYQKNAQKASVGWRYNAQSFLKVVRRPNLLRELSLNFFANDIITDIWCNGLKKGLRKMKFLNRLDLNLDHCGEITDEGIYRLKGGLKTLSSLQQLKFAAASKTNDEWLCHLTEGIKNQKSLKSLSINLRRCKRVTDHGMKHLKEGLKNLDSLQSLSLIFSWCVEITDEGVAHLKESLGGMKSLQYLWLNFHRCTKITDVGLNNLKEVVKTLDSLTHICLNFKTCYNIKWETETSLKKSLKEVLPVLVDVEIIIDESDYTDDDDDD